MCTTAWMQEVEQRRSSCRMCVSGLYPSCGLGKANDPLHFAITTGPCSCRKTTPNISGTTANSNPGHRPPPMRSAEHTSELQSLMRISYAVFCLKKKKHKQQPT